MTPLLVQIQLNIQFINPWAVNSNTRGDDLDLVTPFARGIPAVDVITPTPHGISMPSGGSRLKRGSLLLILPSFNFLCVCKMVHVPA